MYYPEELIEEVRTRNDIVEVISGYVRLQKKGSNYFGLCPFHNEKSPSFSVSPGKQMYYCFGCGAGGNVITFLMEYENQTFPEAVRTLAQRAGIALPEADDSKEAKQADSRRAKLLEINKEAAKYFYYQLRTERGSVGMEYLRKRELSDETMNHFGLGYANKYSNDLIQYLKSKGYSEDLIRDAGLCNVDEKHGMYDKFWNRVMFPIQDINHRVIGFGGRVMGDGKPKYLNSPETEIFDKSRNLYGLNFARTSRKGNVILCEGYMDVIAMHQAGFTQAVASLGTAFTSGQASLLRRYANEILLSYDSDGAGVNAALRAIGILKEAGMTGRVINLEPYKDPDEFIKALGGEEFQKRLDHAENSFFFELRQLQKDERMSTQQKAQRAREIAKKESEKLFIGSEAVHNPVKEFVPLKEVKVGQEVCIAELNQLATVLALPDKNGDVLVRAGIIKTKVPLKGLKQPDKLIKEPQPKTKAQQRYSRLTGDANRPNGRVERVQRSAKMELNLLGLTVDEALPEVDAYIDRAILNGQTVVYLIHGNGTGALRTAIHKHLRGNRMVKSFRLGRYGEGESGVTVVELK